MSNCLDIYQKSVDILFQAYFNDTLEHTACACCAVGNLISGNLRAKPISDHIPSYKGEDGICYSVPWGRYRHDSSIGSDYRRINVNQLIGYSNAEISQIEDAFERVDKGNNAEDFMFNGLVAVLDVLKDIHGIEDKEAQQQHQRFQSHYQSRVAV